MFDKVGRKEFNVILSRIANLESYCKSDIKELRRDIEGLRSDIEGLREELQVEVTIRKDGTDLIRSYFHSYVEGRIDIIKDIYQQHQSYTSEIDDVDSNLRGLIEKLGYEISNVEDKIDSLEDKIFPPDHHIY